jgi:intracellular multiplication protein IcmK
MRFSPNLKKVLLIGTIVLLGCDVSLLFAAENNSSSQFNGSAPSDNPQLQKLQAQIDSLQKPTASDSPPTTGVVQNPSVQNTANGVSVNPLNSPPPSEVKLPPLDNTQIPASPLTQSSNGANVYQPQANSGQFGNAAAVNGGNVNPGQNPPYLSGQPAPTDASSNSKPVSDKDVSDVAFNSMVQNSLPMSPDQIQKLRSAYMASQFAAANVPGTPPRPTATSVFADLSPGATPPVVRLGQGFVTSLVFVDTTGSPWPIESYDVGNPSAFNIQWDKVSNTLMIQSTVLYTYGNLAIKLRGLNTPVMITLIPGQKAIDYRVDMRVPGYGPNAAPFTQNTIPAGTNPDLLNILDGVPPPNSTTLKIDGGNCQGWLSGQKMYVRTRLSILSPGWTATLSSADGMHAYQMQPTPMLLVSQNGQVVQLKAQGF